MFKAIFTAIRNFFFGTETVVTETVEVTVTETVVTETETVVTETITVPLQVSDLLGKDVLAEVARYEYGAWIQKLVPVDIPRSTQVLGTGASEEELMWPWWYHDEPLFERVCELCGATPASIQAGILPEKEYKALREAYRKSGRLPGRARTPEWLELPASPKVMGVLAACKASEDSLRAFENRGAKAQDVTYYISNEALPLVQIGNWGEETYRSCQAWDGRNKRHSYLHGLALRCFAHLEDPSVFVAWAGKADKMQARVILRQMTACKGWKVAAGTQVLVMERWYGDAGYTTLLTEYLKTWAEAQGFVLAQSGGLPENAEGLAETKFYEVGSHKITPYLDNAYAETETGKDPTDLFWRAQAWSKVKICSYFRLVGSSNGDI